LIIFAGGWGQLDLIAGERISLVKALKL